MEDPGERPEPARLTRPINNKRNDIRHIKNVVAIADVESYWHNTMQIPMLFECQLNLRYLLVGQK